MSAATEQMGQKTRTHLYEALVDEAKAHVRLLAFARKAEEEGAQAAVASFSCARDVEEGHARLYKKAMFHLLQDEDTERYVCAVCGYTSDGVLPHDCPTPGPKAESFRKIDWQTSGGRWWFKHYWEEAK